MAKHEFVAGTQVWSTLERLSGRCSKPKFVASAYLGDRAGKLVHLAEGDVLVVALSEANAKNGSVCPREVRRLMDLGVKVFMEDHLHAKVYLFDDVLAVGSPNLSSNSVSTLEETLLVSREQQAIRAATRWFHEMCSTPVTPEWLAYCESVYKPPHRGGRGAKPDRVTSRWWLVGVSETDLPEDEEEDREAGEAEAEELVKAGYLVETIRFQGSSLFVREVKRGDFVIPAWRSGRGRRVYPHARVLETRSTSSTRGAKVLYVYLESPIDPRTVAWSAFKRGMAEVGLRLGRDVGTRELKKQPAVKRAKLLTRHAP